MKMSLKKIRIGELAKKLRLKKSVIRFWEKEFDLQSKRSSGGQRYFTSKDVDRFKNIKNLLYCQGLTIAGAKKLIKKKEETFIHANLNKELKDNINIIGALKVDIEPLNLFNNNNIDINKKITNLHQKLIQLQKLL